MIPRLGMHNYQTQNAAEYLNGGKPLLMRHNCQPLMLHSLDVWAAEMAKIEGKPVYFSCGGTAPGQEKYKTGPMSSNHAVAKLDIFGHGSASCPDLDIYRDWCRTIKRLHSYDIAFWEVWNEADSNTFFRGTVSDLVKMTFAAHEVWGDKVIAPSFTEASMMDPKAGSGNYYGGKRMTRQRFAFLYYTMLIRESKRRGKKLPISATNFHSYGHGKTVAQSAEYRLTAWKRFQKSIRSHNNKELSRLPMWDSEWNLRSIDGKGFPDTEENAKVWRKSIIDIYNLGVKRQYAYLWTDLPSSSGFEVGQLQFNRETPHLNAAFKYMMNRDL